MYKFCKILACMSVLSMAMVSGGYAGDLPNACYAKNECGVRPAIQTFTAVNGALSGTALGSVLLGMPGFVMGGIGGYVVGNELGGKFAMAYEANEYLYFDNGECLQCDTHNLGEDYECSNGIIVTNGSKVVRCQTGLFGDAWVEHELMVCPSSPQNASTKNAKVTIKATYEKPVYSGVAAYSGDACLYIECPDDMQHDKQKNECVAKTVTPVTPVAPVEPVQPIQPVKPVGPIGPTCREQRANMTPEAQACCDWHSSIAELSQDKKRCVCKDASTEFKMNPDGVTGACVAKVGNGNDDNTPAPTYQCPDVTFINIVAICNNNAAVMQLVANIQLMCNNKTITEQQYNGLLTQLNLLAQSCAATVAPVVVDNSGELRAAQSRISSVYKRLQAQVDGFGRSVWKNKEGNFNTSRLASDTIAAVVLGTAGGLITSNVIKKNQVEGGFEDIQCTIGGQSVAGWADEFRVGIQ